MKKYEDIALLLLVYRDIQGVRTGSWTANIRWECREKFIGTHQGETNALGAKFIVEEENCSCNYHQTCAIR
jgi:hypothetical protein